MQIRFEYNYNMEFIFQTHSELTIKGNGIWAVDEQELALEYNNSEIENFEEFCLSYFYNELLNDLNDDSIKFNSNDLKQLEQFIVEYNL